MTPVGKLVRNMVEKAFGRFYEGEEPPQRFDRMVLEFCGFYPKATRAQWAEFCLKFAQQAYREGYVRGWERSERVPDDALPQMPPELAADHFDPTWRERPMVEDVSPVGVPGAEEIPADPIELKDEEWSGPGP